MVLDQPSPHQLIVSILDRPVRAAISCSFQAGGMALLHMLRRYEPDIPVLFVDTGYHFPETLELRDRLTADWGLNLVVLSHPDPVAEHEAIRGILHLTDPDRCCELRKVGPLFEALREFDVWFTGLRWDQAESRRRVRQVERKLLPSGHAIEKVNPLVAWSWDEVLAYHEVHDIPHHPLYDQGFPSIGCAPCTSPADPSDPRAGRWNGQKLECGLHTLTGVGP